MPLHLIHYFHTVRHLKPWQVAGRLVAKVKRKAGFTQLPTSPPSLQNKLTPAVPFPQHDPWNTRAEMLEGRFRFLNQSEQLGDPVDWTAAHAPELWRFNLHYFQYLHLLEPSEQAALCRAWMHANPVGQGVGWHPYPTSLRIVNWCRTGVQDQDVMKSLYLQSAYLYRNIETYVYGNHLLENARALVLAGSFFEGQGEAPQWLDKGLQLFCQQTPEQVLPDGGHYERSPMYHALMLHAYLDVLNVVSPDHPSRQELAETVRSMSDALATVTHPDGRLALFNDATHEIALPPATLQQYVQDVTEHTAQPRTALPEMGYFTHRSDDLYLIVDGGVVGPDYLLAHAHADIFSFELTVGGWPVVVDSGVFEYAPGVMRGYVRSTAAHNTVCIDDVDQVECWDSFRVARRFAPQNVTLTTDGSESAFEGVFGGYATLIGGDIVHARRIRVDDAARTLTVHDAVDGEGTHRVESRIHLHPDVRITHRDEEIWLHHGEAACRLEVESAKIRWEEGWYCPRFGVKRKNRVLVLGGACSLPVELSYRIRY